MRRGTLDSLPPQCGGPVLDGFDWSDHAGDYEERGGIRWGEFVVTGHFDGKRIEVTKIVPEDEYVRPEPSPEPDRFKTPCPEPAGGWKVVDPDKASDFGYDKAIHRATKFPGFADAWVDQRKSYTILNVRFTHDLDAAEEAIRESWGGPLCVSKAERDQAEIRRIGRAMGDLPGVFSYGGDNEPIEASVIWDDGSLQAWVDHEYSEGVVTVYSALTPVPSDR